MNALRGASVWSAVIAAVGLHQSSAAVAQEVPSTRLYRLVQGGVEVGRESYRVAGGAIERTVTIPLLNLRMVSRAEYDSAGRFVRFEASVSNATGDTTRGRYVVEAGGDSLVVTTGLGEPRARVLRTRADGVIPAQTVSVIAEAVERSAGRDTTFRFLPMGADTTVPVSVRREEDGVSVSLAGVSGMLRPGGTIEVPASRVVVNLWNGHDSLPPLSGMRRPPVDYSAPPGAPYTAGEATIPIRTASGDTFSLAATLTLPVSGRGPFPVVVTISGSGQQTRDEELWPILERYRPFREFAERFAQSGIGVLRYDDRGIGGSGGPGGTSADYADDVRQMVAWLRSRPEVDGRRIALLGHSEGGIIGPLAAAEDSRIAAVVIMAGPSRSGREVVRYQLRRAIETAPGLTTEARERQLAGVEQQLDSWARMNAWTRWFDGFDPLTVARRLRMPVLILHGALDRQVSAGQADTLGAAIRAAGNRDVTVKVYPGLNHLFLPTDGDGSPTEYLGLRQQNLPREVLDDAATWLAARLRR